MRSAISATAGLLVSRAMQTGIMCVRLNEGMTGKVILDEFADREPDYWITDMAPNGTFVKVAEVVNIDLKTRVSSCNPETWERKKI